MTTFLGPTRKTLRLSALLFANHLRFSSSSAAAKAAPFNSAAVDFESVIRSRCLSGNLDLDEALGYFDSLVLTRPLPGVWNFNHLFGSLSKLGHHSVVVSMYRVVSGFSEFRPEVGTLTIVMKCFCRLERADLGFSVLATILKLGLKPNAHTLTTLLEALFARGGSKKMAVELFSEILEESFPCNEFTYATFITGLCKAGEASRALRVLRHMYRDKWVRADANCFGPIIDAFCKEGHVDQSLSLFAEMVENGIKPSAVVFNSLIRGLAKLRRWSEAERLFVDMDCWFGILPNVCTYNIIIDALGKEERFRDAIHVFELMLSRGSEPSVVTFSSLLSCLLRCSRLEEGYKLFKAMKSFGLCPNILMFTTMFDALCKKGRITEALSLIDEMSKSCLNPDVFIYTSLIQGLSRLGRVDLGFSVLATMVKRGVEPNARTLAALLRGLCLEGSVVKAKEHFQAVMENGHLCNEFTYAILINALCKLGQTKKALKLLNQMRKKRPRIKPDASCYNPNQMRKKRPRIKPDASCYNPIIDTLCKEQRLDKAVELFENMISSSNLSSVLMSNPLIQGLYLSGRWEEANGFIIDMLNKHSIYSDFRTYDVIIESLRKKNYTHEVIPLLRSISTNSVRPNVVTFNSLLSVLSKRGQWNEASELASLMGGLGISHDSFTLSSMVHGLCKKGRFAEALNLMEKMSSVGVKSDVVVYNSLIQGFCNSGQWFEVNRYLDKMVAESVFPSVVTFTILTESLIKQGRSKEALMLLKEMAQMGLVPDHRMRMLLKKIIESRMKNDQWV